MQNLNEYLAGQKHGEFAQKLGISGPYLSQILSGVRRPGLDLAIKIERETDGKVPVYTWAKQRAAS